MRRRLQISITLTFLAFGGLIIWLALYARVALALSQLQIYELAAVVVAAFSLLVSLCIELNFVLPFKTFLNELSTTWQKKYSLAEVNDQQLVELRMIATACSEILAESETRIKALSNKAELSEGYHQIIMMASHQLRTPSTG